MSQVWCVVSESSVVAETIADALVDAGHSVVIPRSDVSPLAMLVNRRHDAVLPIEILDSDALSEVVAAIDESYGEVDVFAMVLDPAVPPHVAAVAKAFAGLQPQASLVLLTGTLDDDDTQQETQRMLNVALEARVRKAMSHGQAGPRHLSVVALSDLPAWAAAQTSRDSA
jgi:hypothetical protein